ncbi:MAG TPA: DUF86 domain-containing protein [Armatimonadota bacterium]|nr:DUF86 domain-containing protein [Armatimonadota bacterium]HOS42688.1 DUF86 domain-containing protein [Armatimonadota bacterium]
MRDDRERLRDMLEALERIEKYTALGQHAFEQDELIQTWIVHHLEIVGEAMRGLSAAFRERHPELPWSPVIGMRNVLIHGYFQIDLALVWRTAATDAPMLKQKIAALLAE